jgi:hypothetical protein
MHLLSLGSNLCKSRCSSRISSSFSFSSSRRITIQEIQEIKLDRKDSRRPQMRLLLRRVSGFVLLRPDNADKAPYSRHAIRHTADIRANGKQLSVSAWKCSERTASTLGGSSCACASTASTTFARANGPAGKTASSSATDACAVARRNVPGCRFESRYHKLSPPGPEQCSLGYGSCQQTSRKLERCGKGELVIDRSAQEC